MKLETNKAVEMIEFLGEGYNLLSEEKIKIFNNLYGQYLENRDFDIYNELNRIFSVNDYLLTILCKETNAGHLFLQHVLINILDNELLMPINKQRHQESRNELLYLYAIAIDKWKYVTKGTKEYTIFQKAVALLPRMIKLFEDGNTKLYLRDNIANLIKKYEYVNTPSGEETKLKLTKELTKIKGDDFFELAEDIQKYRKEDVYKIIRHVNECRESFMHYNPEKSDFEIDRITSYFHDIPVYAAVMEGKVPKGIWNPKDMFIWLSTRYNEEIERMSYYPLNIESIDEFYLYVLKYFTRLRENGELTLEEHLYLEYKLAESVSRFSEEASSVYIDKTIKIVNGMVDKLLKLTRGSSLESAVTVKYTYTMLDELFLYIRFRYPDAFPRKGETFSFNVKQHQVSRPWILVNNELEIPKKTEDKNISYIVAQTKTVAETWHDIEETLLLNFENHLNQKGKEKYKAERNWLEKVKKAMNHFKLDTMELPPNYWARWIYENVKAGIKKNALTHEEKSILAGAILKWKEEPVKYLLEVGRHHLTNFVIDLVNEQLLDVSNVEILEFILDLDIEVAYKYELLLTYYQHEKVKELAALVQKRPIDSYHAYEDRKHAFVVSYFKKHI
ncbi:hypothetical protein CN918_26525 [Priestia megaterium]|nr:hypothetical protein CN918_26525 [Priestia megaterium]